VALTSGLLLDTHTWLWWEAGTLTARADILEEVRQAASESELSVSSFSLIEIANAVARKRLRWHRPLLPWFQSSLQSPGPRLIGLTPEIAAATSQLPDEFHGDPGDRILAATAIIHNLTIVTHDDLMLRFGKQGLYRTLKVNELKELK
jgi:PIN domain nuclease of toxin-antitoxin system